MLSKATPYGELVFSEEIVLTVAIVDKDLSKSGYKNLEKTAITYIRRNLSRNEGRGKSRKRSGEVTRSVMKKRREWKQHRFIF